jgi:transposase-like protein
MVNVVSWDRSAHFGRYIDRFSQYIWNHRAFPKEHCKKIRTTNGLERINKELKRRSRVVGAFPNDEALLRLGVAILMDINEEWLTGRKYLSMIEE